MKVCMSCKKIRIGFLFLLTIGFAAHAQNIKKALGKADYFYENQNFKAAVPAYLEALAIEPNHPEANYRLGRSYLETIHHLKSMPYLERAYKLNPTIHPHIQYYLAVSYHYNHKFAEAIKIFKDFRTKLDTKKDVELIERIDKRVKECENGIEYMKTPVKAQIDNMGKVVNSKYREYAPVISADESILVFTSRREGSTGGFLDEENGEFFEDIYISYKKNGVWTAPVNIGKPINSEGHDASVAISPNGTEIFVYKGENQGDLYVSKFVEGKWSKPVDLGKNINTKYGETSVTMTADGNTIYFTSDRPGGFGGLDIYVSKKDKKGNWGEAIHLGKPINTPYDEDAPFIHADSRTLYFVSAGHATMGGYDIFKSSMKPDGTWGEPENLGYPINTADDDIYFVLSADNKRAYYSSERENGNGEDDLYVISMPKPEELATVSTKEVDLGSTATKKKIAPVAKVEAFNPITILKGTVKDAMTKAPLESKLLVIDNEKNEVISEILTNALTGGFLVILPSGKNYGITVEKKDYLFHSENFDIPVSTNYQEVNKDIELKKVAIGTKIVLRNIFFDFDKATLRPESSAELERLLQLLKDVPSMRIEISGHTDNKGSADYNKSLSEKRAKAVVDYLVNKGIASDRLKFAGYGFDRPMATNDTEDGRQLNRRTEFEIIQ